MTSSLRSRLTGGSWAIGTSTPATHPCHRSTTRLLLTLHQFPPTSPCTQIRCTLLLLLLVHQEISKSIQRSAMRSGTSTAVETMALGFLQFTMQHIHTSSGIRLSQLLAALTQPSLILSGSLSSKYVVNIAIRTS